MRQALLDQHRHMHLHIALQEWALVCQHLAEGSCSVLLRKGGIHDNGGLFESTHRQFVLLPSFLHQDPSRLRRLPVEQPVPVAAMHELRIWAEVATTWRVEDLGQLLDVAASQQWPWSDAELEKRFYYRDKPFLYVLLLRSYRLVEPVCIPDDPRYAGCKSWLGLDQALDCDTRRPVLDSEVWEQQRQQLQSRFGHVAGPMTGNE